MIFRTVSVIFIMMLSAETLPVPKMNFRPVSVNQAEQNLRRPHSQVAFYPFFPVGRSPQIIPGHHSSPIHGPAVQVSAILDRKKKKIDGFLPSSIFLDRYHNNIHQQSAQEVKQLAQRVRDNVQLNKKHHGQRMQHVKEMIDNKFKFDGVMDRLRGTFARKKALMNKLHSFGRREKFVGIPYHTMNDDHMIVKKPGVDFNPTYLPNVETSIAVPVPAIEPIATQHPVLPVVTTSVELHQEWEVPGAIDGYVFPITSAAPYTPEVTETTEITISIDQGKSTTPLVPENMSNYTDTTVPTTISTHSESESDSVAEVETIFASVDQISAIGDEKFESTTFHPDPITEISSILFSLPSSTDTASQTEIMSLEPQASSTIMSVDLFSDIQVKPVTSSVIDVESTTNNIRSTFPPPAITITIDDEPASSVIDAIETIISTVPSTFSAETTFGTGETSPHALALENITIVGETPAIMETVFTSPVLDPESNSEAVSTVPSSLPIEISLVASEISATIDTAAYGSPIDRKMTTDIVSTMPGTIATETTLRPSLSLDTVQSSDLSFGLEYDRLPSSPNKVETIFEVDSKIFSTIPTEENTLATERSTTIDSAFDNSTMESKRNIETIPTYFSFLPTTTTTTSDEMSTTPESDYNRSTNHRETTTEVVIILPSTIPSDTPAWPPVALETASLVDVSSGSESRYVSSFIDDRATTVEDESTLLSTISTKVTEELTVVDAVDDNPKIEMEKSTDAISTFFAFFETQTSTSLENLSTIANSQSADSISTNHGETMAGIITTVPSIISSETTAWPSASTQAIPPTAVSSGLGYNYFQTSTDEVETTAGAGSTFSSTIATEMRAEILTTVDPISNDSTSEMERIEEIALSFSTSLPTERITSFEEPSTMVELNYNGSVGDGDTTMELVPTLPTTDSAETTSWLTPAVETTPLVDILPRFGYGHYPSSTNDVETTTEIDSTFPSMIATELVTDILATTDSAIDNSIIEFSRTTAVLPTFSLLLPTETTIAIKGISTAADVDYISLTSHGETTFSTTWPLPASERTPLVDVLSRFGYNRVSSSTDEIETSTRVESTSSSTILIGTTTVVTERPTAVDPASIIEQESSTEISPNFPFETLPETTPVSEETSTTTSSQLASSKNAEVMTDKGPPTFPPTVPTEPTMTPVSETATVLNASPRFQHTHVTSSTIGLEPTAAVHSSLYSTIPTETSTMVIEGVTTVDSTSDRSAIEMEVITKTVPEWSLETSTEAPAISNDSPTTTIDPTSGIVSTLPSTISSEAVSWPVTDSEITPVVDATPKFRYNRFPDLTDEMEKTTVVDSTFLFAIPVVTTTVATERLTTVDLGFDILTIDEKTTTDIVPTISSIISTETAAILGEKSTTVHLDNFFIDEIRTVDVSPTTNSIFPTTAPISKIPTTLEGLQTFGHDHFIFSTIAPETDDGVDSRVPSTISTETIAIEAEISGTSALESSPFDVGITTDIDTVIGLSVPTEKTATSKEIFTIGSLPFDSSTISEETTPQVDLTLPSTTVPTGNETIASVEEISSATDSATTSSTDDGDTTTEIDSTLPTTISNETTVVSTHKWDAITEQNSGYLGGNQANLDKRNARFLNTNLDPAWPRFAHNSEEEPSEKTSLDLIPMIIEYYAKIT